MMTGYLSVHDAPDGSWHELTPTKDSAQARHVFHRLDQSI
jgi:hypothetical protein